MKISLFLISLLLGTNFSLAGVCEKSPSADLSLLLAIDVSASMDEDELRIQMDGYSQALLDPAVVENLTHCTCAEISVVFWADDQKILVPFQRINGLQDLNSIVQTIQATKPLMYASVGSLGSRTNMLGVLQYANFSMNQLAEKNSRKTLLISGDGLDTYLSETLVGIREQKNFNEISGIQVVGAPIELHYFQQSSFKTPNSSSEKPYWADYPEVEKFYRNEVVTSDGFVVPAKDYVDLQRALTDSLRILSCNLMM